jgi:hypothetical protein
MRVNHALLNMSDQNNQRKVDGLLGSVSLYNGETAQTCKPKAAASFIFVPRQTNLRGVRRDQL